MQTTEDKLERLHENPPKAKVVSEVRFEDSWSPEWKDRSVTTLFSSVALPELIHTIYTVNRRTAAGRDVGR